MWLTIREVAGWTFVVLGILMVLYVVLLVMDSRIIESFALSFPAAFVFRAGIGLVRFSSAARIALKLREPNQS